MTRPRIYDSHGVGKLRLEFLRQMVAEGTFAAIDDAPLVDVFTASMLVAIADALSEANRERFLTMPMAQMVDIGWKLTRKAG